MQQQHKSFISRLTAWFSGLLLWVSVNAQAALPTPVAPSTGAPQGNWLSLIQGYAKDAGLVIGLVIATVAFLWIAWITIAKFNEARAGRAEWGEVGLTAIVAAGVMVFISFLLTEAANTIV
jgi:integrating conjugative element membrane protein (TIGR03745 family)